MFDFGFGGSGLFRFLFRSFRLFRWFRSGCSGGFVPVVPGFSTVHAVVRDISYLLLANSCFVCKSLVILTLDIFLVILIILIMF